MTNLEKKEVSLESKKARADKLSAEISLLEKEIMEIKYGALDKLMKENGIKNYDELTAILVSNLNAAKQEQENTHKQTETKEELSDILAIGKEDKRDAV